VNVSSVTTRAEAPADEATDLGTADPELRLALLMLENEQALIDADRETVKAAREARKAALEAEVESLREAADAKRGAAATGASLTIASGCMQVTANLQADDCGTPDSYWAIAGDASGKLAQPASDWIANEKAYAADQAAARGLAEQAGWEAEDAKEHQQRMERIGDRILDTVQQNLRDNQSSRLSILNRV
jgi:hypothetical protein